VSRRRLAKWLNWIASKGRTIVEIIRMYPVISFGLLGIVSLVLQAVSKRREKRPDV